MLYLIIAATALLLALGFEMFLVLGLPALAIKAAFYDRLPDIVLVQRMVGGVNHTTLLAIPFFIFAAEIMARGQIAARLVALVRALTGHLRGGAGHAAIGGAMAFGSVSGSAPATVAALGRMLFPELRRAGFSDRFSLGLIVASAETALLIPPSITLIIYGWITGVSVAALFAGGLSIGITLGLAFSALVAWRARADGLGREARASGAERLAALRAAGWALGMPGIILGGIYSGLFTPTEAAAVSVVYALVVEMGVYRNLDLKGLFRVTEAAALSTSVIFVLLAMGAMLSYFITLAQAPQAIAAFLQAIDAGPIEFLLIVNICFLVAGMFIDPNSALLILVPPLFPVATALGVDPVHFGMIVTLNICIGMITPPFGLDIFVASSTLNRPVVVIISGVWPFVAVNIAVLLLVTYVPAVSLFIPNLLMR